MTIKQLYEKLHGDYEDATRRLLNDKMISRFVLKFLEDPTFEQLSASIAAKDIETSFRAVHTLKGLSGSLSFTELYQKSFDLTEQLRPRLDQADPLLFKAVEQAYRLCVESIEEYRDNME